MEALEAELREPKYGEYYLCQWVNRVGRYPCCDWPLTVAFLDFSNILTKAKIERLAEVDEYEVVREVQVCYSDTY